MRVSKVSADWAHDAENPQVNIQQMHYLQPGRASKLPSLKPGMRREMICSTVAYDCLSEDSAKQHARYWILKDVREIGGYLLKTSFVFAGIIIFRLGVGTRIDQLAKITKISPQNIHTVAQVAQVVALVFALFISLTPIPRLMESYSKSTYQIQRWLSDPANYVKALNQQGFPFVPELFKRDSEANYITPYQAYSPEQLRGMYASKVDELVTQFAAASVETEKKIAFRGFPEGAVYFVGQPAIGEVAPYQVICPTDSPLAIKLNQLYAHLTTFTLGDGIESDYQELLGELRARQASGVSLSQVTWRLQQVKHEVQAKHTGMRLEWTPGNFAFVQAWLEKVRAVLADPDADLGDLPVIEVIQGMKTLRQRMEEDSGYRSYMGLDAAGAGPTV